ncbi:protein of unknown function [Burkholderia multivorans]
MASFARQKAGDANDARHRGQCAASVAGARRAIGQFFLFARSMDPRPSTARARMPLAAARKPVGCRMMFAHEGLLPLF